MKLPHKEKDISTELDQRIRKNLCICFPEDISYFSHARGWKDTLPSETIVALDEHDDPIAHIGVVHRDITVEDEPYRVFGFQNVYVIPQHRGTRLIDLLFEQLLISLKEDNFDFGLLFSKPKVAPLYIRMGWQKMDDVEVTTKESLGVIANRPLIHDSMYFFPMQVTTVPKGTYFLNGPDW